MESFTPTSASLVRYRAWLLAGLLVVLAMGTASAAGNPIYSTSGVASASSSCLVPALCSLLGGGVTNPGQAANGSNTTDYATMTKFVTVGKSVSLRLGLDRQASAGDRVGMLVAPPASLAGVSALGTYTLRTYLRGSNTAVETQVVSLAVVQSLRLVAGTDRPMQIEFTAKQAFDDIELEIGGTVDVLYRLNIYYAYAIQSLVQQPVRGLTSHFPASDLSSYYNTAITPGDVVSVCGNTNIYNPEYTVDNSLTNHATFGTFVSVNCPSSLSVKLESSKTAPAGYYAGFVLGSSGIIDLAALSALRITTYKTINGVSVKQESATGANLLDVKLLPDGKYQVSFPTKYAFDEVKIEQISALSALDNLDIYYGFGVEPAAFTGTTRYLSDFGQPVSNTNYATNTSAVVCVGCGVSNPAGAADNDPATKAVINIGGGIASTAELKLDLRAPGSTVKTDVGQAGYRAGMIISNNSGLLDAGVLSRLTLSTYDAAGNLLESAAGSSLLSLNLLPDGRQEVSFLTTKNFASIQISAASTAALGVNINVYQAFADNLAGGIISTIIPLPVELTAFVGKWANGAAELNWTTATEKNSRYFAVERSVSSEAAFKAVGQVAAAGSSTSPLSYKLRDAEAGTLGVTTLYYRLRQVDNDGTQSFSPVVVVTVGKAVAVPQLEAYPNPASNAQAVQVRFINMPADGGLVQTYSEMGQLVSQQPVGSATTGLALPGLAPGLYHVVLRDAAGQRLATQRLVVSGR
ncbi:T9SS type A sorting domain-containing protein [Hymenobacter ruber]